jgi:hypothetical protein
MLPVSQIINKVHDKKRKIEYWKIVKRVEEENKKNPHRPPKNIIGDKPKERSSSESQKSSMV